MSGAEEVGSPHLGGSWLRRAPPRYALILCIDGVVTALSFYLAYLLRFEGRIPAQYLEQFQLTLPVLLAVRLATIMAGSLHRWSFRMAGLNEGVRLVLTTMAGTACLVVVAFFLRRAAAPRSVTALEFFFTTALMAAFRYAPRLAIGWYSDQILSRRKDAHRTIIVGAGKAGDLLLRDLLGSRSHAYHVIGFVDDDPRKLGTSIGGKPVLCNIESLPAVIRKHRVSNVLLSIPRLEAQRIRTILRLCSSLKVSFKIIPASFTYMDERITAAMLHDLSAEDLLPRDAVAFDPKETEALVAGRRVLVTGAGGSIGGEIARQIAGRGAAELVLVDMNENELYLLTRRLQERHPSVRIRAEVADVRDRARLLRLGELARPQDIFHAAAHKHVPLMEDAPDEAVKNNVFGTLNAAKMAEDCAAERFVLISTDKAVRPASVMGASKRVAELIVRSMARTSRTQFATVRFGNVLGSSGSVVPLFKQQIERGGPVTVTHPDCTRYFMTIAEAVGLVIIAGLGGYGELCVLDMGEPIRIADLAENLITIAGHVPGVDIPIVYTGLRPGEKINEELLTEDEEKSRAVRNRILVAQCPPPPPALHETLDELGAAAARGDRTAIRGLLGQLVPSYQPAKAEAASNVVAFRPSGSRSTVR